MDQHAEHLALYQYGQPQGQLAPPLWLLHMNRHPEPVHRSHVYSSSVIYFPVEPTQWYVRARLRLNEFDMYSITISAIPHPPARSTGFIYRHDMRVGGLAVYRRDVTVNPDDSRT